MFDNIYSIFSMDGYGIYVWPCYALLLVLLSWQIYVAIKRNITIQQNITQDLRDGSSSD